MRQWAFGMNKMQDQGLATEYWLILLLALTSCVNDPKPKVVVNEPIRVHGDPMEFVVGAELNPSLEFKDFTKGSSTQMYHLVSAHNVVREEPKPDPSDQAADQPQDQNQDFSHLDQVLRMASHRKVQASSAKPVSAKNYKTDANQRYEAYPFRTSWRGSDVFVLELDNRKARVSSRFEIDAKSFKVVAIDTVIKKNSKTVTESVQWQGQLLHFSESHDSQRFSLLLRGKGFISALVFERPKPRANFSNPIDGSEYYYFRGRGVAISWPKATVEINFCGRSRDMYESFQKSLASWQSAVGEQVEISGRWLDQYPPFSDLNQHCIYEVSDYLTVISSRWANSAYTLVGAGWREPEIYDADVFMLHAEIKKHEMAIVANYKKNKKQMREASLKQTTRAVLGRHYQEVLVHELGHVLGLGHPFSEADPKGEVSVMNYDHSLLSPTPYDIEAILNLYKPPAAL